MSSSVARFGTFEANFRSGELRKSGIKLKLPGQPLQVLEVLLERPGAVVTRDELRSRLWPGDTFVDFDNALNTAVNKLREALSDTAVNPRFIETLPRRGYRFLAPVELPATVQRIRGDAKPMLAVLPFENLGGDREQEYFADGMTEEMICQLGRVHAARLGVIARTSAMQYKATRKSVQEVAQELNVDFIVEGTVRRQGERVRISVQLVRASNQIHLWAESYDRTLGDVFSTQAEVANEIGRALVMELLPGQQTVGIRTHRTNAAAYDAYLKGRFHWNKRTETGFKKALECYHQSVALDPAYALPRVGLANIYAAVGMWSGVGWNSFHAVGDAGRMAQTAATKALELEETLAEAHTALAFVKFLYDWDWGVAEKEFRFGLQTNPNQADGFCWYALFLAAMGRFDEAVAQADEALQLDPLSLVTGAHRGRILYFARRFEEAVEQLQRTLDMDANFPLAHFGLGLTYQGLGDFPKAMAEFERAFESSGHPEVCTMLRALASTHAASQQTPHRESSGEFLQEAADKFHLSPYPLAILYLSLGAAEPAMACLERAYEQRSCWLVNLKVEAALDGVRADPRFQSLLRRVGLAV